MDSRIREHASVVFDHSLDMSEGDNLVIDAHPVSEDLVVALHELAADRS